MLPAYTKFRKQEAGEDVQQVLDSNPSTEQFPVTLAWALTVHKAQGSTFDSIVIGSHLGFFAFGQFYVALSRCRTLEGVRIHGRLKESHVAAHPGVLKYEYA